MLLPVWDSDDEMPTHTCTMPSIPSFLWFKNYWIMSAYERTKKTGKTSWCFFQEKPHYESQNLPFM